MNLRYANQHQYDFFLERCIDDENKLSVCTKYLSNYHHILFITDPSIVIINNCVKIEELVDKYITDKNVMVLSNDWHEKFLNSKVMLIKNCSLSFEILNYWNNYANIIDELDIGYEVYTEHIQTIQFNFLFEKLNVLPKIIFSFVTKRNLIIFGLFTSIFLSHISFD